MVNKEAYKENRLRRIERNKADQRKYCIIAIALAIPTAINLFIGIFSGAVLFGIGVVVCLIISMQSGNEAERLQTEIDTMDDRDLEAEQREIEWRYHAAMQSLKQKNAMEHPQCPMCHRSNTRRITNTARVASVATLGLASSKIGKTFECLDCKYKW